MKINKLIPAVLVSMLISVCSAGTQEVVLSIQADTTAKTFKVFGTATDDGTTIGISALELHVWGSDGATVTYLTNTTPYTDTSGFLNFRDDGREVLFPASDPNGVGTGIWYISGAQQTIYSGIYSPTKDAKVFQKVGIAAGASWAYPVLLAEGCYTGLGSLHTDIPPLSPGFGLLKNVTGTGWRGPGCEMPANSVVPAVADVSTPPAGPKGTLTINTAPVRGPISINGQVRGTGSWTDQVDYGTYTVSFGQVDGYTKPDDQTATVNSAQGATITGTYTKIPDAMGALSITASPVNGSVIVNGTSWGTAPQNKAVAPGTYTVTFGDVSGYTTPAAQTVNVIAGQTVDVAGAYVSIPSTDPNTPVDPNVPTDPNTSTDPNTPTDPNTSTDPNTPSTGDPSGGGDSQDEEPGDEDTPPSGPGGCGFSGIMVVLAVLAGGVLLHGSKLE